MQTIGTTGKRYILRQNLRKEFKTFKRIFYLLHLKLNIKFINI